VIDMGGLLLTWCKDCCHVTGHKEGYEPKTSCEACHSSNVRIGPFLKGNRRHYKKKRENRGKKDGKKV
jgi:formylglycine-generating enzyme required for sulfatase activity